MPPIRPRTTLLLGIVAFGSLISHAWGQRMGRYTLNPKTYKSPSGEYELRVDPSTIYGQGEGSYRMTRKGAEIWAKKLPFTLWDAAVTDEGVVAGYAYSLGRENEPMKRLGPDDPFDSVEGKLHLVIIDPQGGLRMNQVLPRRGMESCTTSIDRNVMGFMLDPENDRFIVRCREGGWSSRGEAWRVFQLSSGELLDEFEFDHPKDGEHELWFVLSAKPVAGTPLILVNWEYSKYDDTGNQLRENGGAFTLVDPSGGAVWEHELPGDYPEYYEYSKRLDREKDREELDRLRELEREIRDNGAILRARLPGRFDVWFVKDDQRVTFGVTKDADGKWQVAELARTGYDKPVPEQAEKHPDELELLSLKHLGTIELQTDVAPPPDIRNICYFDIDDRGRLGLLREDDRQGVAFLLVDPEDGIISTVDLSEALGDNYNCQALASLEGERWLVHAWIWREIPDRDKRERHARAWFLDAETRKITPIEPYPEECARDIAATGDGGFVVATDPRLGTSDPEQLVMFDAKGRECWRYDPRPGEGWLSGTTSVTVTRDGTVVAKNKYGSSLCVFGKNGDFLTSHRCDEFFDDKRSFVDAVVADNDGGLIVSFSTRPPRIWRVDLDGTVRSKCEPRYPDGRAVNFYHKEDASIRVDRTGRLWINDGHSLLQLNQDGVVERVLGEAPDSAELRRVGGVAIDQQGTIYIAEERNGITQVFDSSGRRVRLLRPNPDDFEPSWGFRIDVASDGSVFVSGLEFSPSGERVGIRKLPADVEEPDLFFGRVLHQPHNQRYWVVSSEVITLIGEDNAILRTEKRRPDRNWLNHISASGVAPDGSLVVAAGSFDALGGSADRRGTINLYTASGDPVKTIEVPNIGERSPLEGRLAFSGRYVVTGPRDYETPHYALLDTRAEPPKWYDLGTLVRYKDRWRCFFTKEGEELWMFAEEARKVERFELPAHISKADDALSVDH